MDFQLEQAVEILSRTPATLTGLLGGLSDAWTRSTEGPETWSAFDIVGHLLHGDEADWMVRARFILYEGAGRPFDSYNRTAMFQKYDGYTLDQLLAAFEQARAKNLATLREWHLTPDQLTRTGTHPALGTVTLSQLLASWVVHDLNHIGQAVEVMARQYGEAVGPWSAYLAILTRPVLTE
jgi:uncharacterized damage-inducible protein DinB